MNTSLISTLSDAVTARAGLTRVQPADCKKMSLDIKSVTGYSVSETTLKRFFGFAASQYHLSGFSKNVLSQYLGFADWQDFVLFHSGSRPQKNATYWETLQNKARRISDYTFQALSNRSGIPYKATVDRAFAEQQVSYFLESDYLATSFIAPGGYGKSILLTRLVEKFWLAENARFKNDIVWFVSGQTLGGLLNMGFDLDTWFMHQIGLVEEENIREYFAKNEGEVRGRFIMILDGFDEVTQRDDQMQAFFARILDFMTVNQEYKWIKIILSVRSHTWEYIHAEIKSSDFFSRHWYEGQTFTDYSLINVPLLSEQEVMRILANLYDSGRPGAMETAMLRQLSNPFYIQLLYQLQKLDSSVERKAEHINYFDLVSEFINKKIYQTRYSSEKVSIIKRFLENTQQGKNPEYMEKDQLVPEVSDFRKAYAELLSYGLLVEENQSSNLVFRKTVFFNHLNLLEYFLAMEVLTTFKHTLSAELFKYAGERYSDSKFKVPVFKWLMYFGVQDFQISGIDYLRELNTSPVEKEELIVFFSELLGKRFLDEQGQLRAELSRYLPATRFFFSCFMELGFTSAKYEQALDIFAKLAGHPSEKICLRASLVSKAFAAMNSHKMLASLEALRDLGEPEAADFELDPYKLLNWIYVYFTTGVQDEAIRQKVVEYAAIKSKDGGRAPSTPYERLLYGLILTLVRVVESPAFSEEVLQGLFPSRGLALSRIRKSPIEFFFLVHLSHVHLLAGRRKEALRIIAFIKFYRGFYPHGHFNPHFRSIYDLLLVRLALANGQLALAVRLDQKLRKTAIEDDVLYMAILSARSLVAWYRERGRSKDVAKIISTLQKQVHAGHFHMDNLLTNAASRDLSQK